MNDDRAASETTDATACVVALEREPTSQVAADQLYAAVYGELRSIARNLMRDQRADHTLQPTALVNEAFLKLVNADRISWRGRAHFLCIAARAMRQILVNHARNRAAAKRGGAWQQVTINSAVDGKADHLFEVVALDQALDVLAGNDTRLAQVIELRVFAGMTAREVAQALDVSKRTVDSELRYAKLWLLDKYFGEA